jgi:hypothetical protein
MKKCWFCNKKAIQVIKLSVSKPAIEKTHVDFFSQTKGILTVCETHLENLERMSELSKEKGKGEVVRFTPDEVKTLELLEA